MTQYFHQFYSTAHGCYIRRAVFTNTTKSHNKFWAYELKFSSDDSLIKEYDLYLHWGKIGSSGQCQRTMFSGNKVFDFLDKKTKEKLNKGYVYHGPKLHNIDWMWKFGAYHDEIYSSEPYVILDSNNIIIPAGSGSIDVDFTTQTTSANITASDIINYRNKEDAKYKPQRKIKRTMIGEE